MAGPNLNFGKPPLFRPPDFYLAEQGKVGIDSAELLLMSRWAQDAMQTRMTNEDGVLRLGSGPIEDRHSKQTLNLFRRFWCLGPIQ